jgi:uncharacterized membrane protein
MPANTKDTKLAAKKAAVLDPKTGTRIPLIVTAAVVLALLAGGWWYLGTGTPVGAPASVQPVQAAQAAGGDDVRLPVAQFDDGKARHFDYKHGKLTIRYFVIKSADGVLRAAFDACDVCWPAGKGYAQEGDVMVCRNCGRRFASVSVNEVKGGCNPAPLERRVENGMLVIRVSDILEGKTFFDFSRKA